MRGLNPVYFLVDNGSLRPEASLNLLRIAADLSSRVGHIIQPVSLLHSDKVPPAALDGRPAAILVPTLRACLEAGKTDFVILPLFFGPSRALTHYIPQQVDLLKHDYPQLTVTLLPPLVNVDEPADFALAHILLRLIHKVVAEQQLLAPKVVMVDHGTPARAVNAVRNHLGNQLRELLPKSTLFSVASMERRDGKKYAFNEPLLENILGRAPFNQGAIVVSMLFLSPGRHAGHGGDIDMICAKAQAQCKDLTFSKTGLVGEVPELVDILESRFRAWQSCHR